MPKLTDAPHIRLSVRGFRLAVITILMAYIHGKIMKIHSYKLSILKRRKACFDPLRLGCDRISLLRLLPMETQSSSKLQMVNRREACFDPLLLQCDWISKLNLLIKYNQYIWVYKPKLAGPCNTGDRRRIRLPDESELLIFPFIIAFSHDLCRKLTKKSILCNTFILKLEENHVLCLHDRRVVLFIANVNKLLKNLVLPYKNGVFLLSKCSDAFQKVIHPPLNEINFLWLLFSSDLSSFIPVWHSMIAGTGKGSLTVFNSLYSVYQVMFILKLMLGSGGAFLGSNWVTRESGQ